MRRRRIPWSQRDGATLDDVAEDAQAGATGLAPLLDHGPDPALSEQATVDVVVIATVSQQSIRAAPRPADRARERDALPVDGDVVLAARPCAVDRAGRAFGPLPAALTGEESITARPRSSWFFDRSFSSSRTCSLSQTPASFPAARRRQQVMPEPKPSSWGRSPTGCRYAARRGCRTGPAGPAPAVMALNGKSTFT